jgi:hypothetical protein
VYLESAPTAAPQFVFSKEAGGEVCRGGAATEASDSIVGNTWVDVRPAGAIVVWEPGLNSTTCRAELTNLDAASASAVADAIRNAPLVGAGQKPCPSDDETRVLLYFQYSGKKQDEYVEDDLTGCGGLSAPHRWAREETPAIRTALRVAAPAEWRSYF